MSERAAVTAAIEERLDVAEPEVITSPPDAAANESEDLVEALWALFAEDPAARDAFSAAFSAHETRRAIVEPETIASSPAATDASAPSSDPTFTSHRLAALATALAQDPAASEGFWTEVATTGVPLLEPHPDRLGARLVTFLFRDAGPRQNIVLRHGFIGDHPADYQLTHLGETDVWYLTLALRDDVQASYMFALDDPLTEVKTFEEYLARAATWVADPFNRLISARTVRRSWRKTLSWGSPFLPCRQPIPSPGFGRGPMCPPAP